MTEIGTKARAAAAELAYASQERKYAALIGASHEIWNRRQDILDANCEDLVYAEEKGLSAAMIDRLTLDEGRIRGIVDGLRAIAEQRDPVGRVLAEWDMPSGLHIQRVATPLGVVGVIYESRPNVTADAGALCLKAGNAVILRGGIGQLSHLDRHSCLHGDRVEAGRPARGGDPADPDAGPPDRDRHAAGGGFHRRDRAAGRQGAGRSGAARGAGAGFCASGRHLPRLCRPRRRSGQGAAGRSELQDPADRDLRGGGMPADRLAVLYQARGGADRRPDEGRGRGADRGRIAEGAGHGQGRAR